MEDKVIVATGASSGIGAAFARLAGSAGAKLLLVARRVKELSADVYTQPMGRQLIAAYYGAEDMGEAEQQPPFVFGAPRTS